MLLEVGRIVKPHGIRGEVLVDLVTDRTERVAAGMVLHSDIGPLTIIRSTAHQGRWIVAFEGILDRNRTEQMRGLILRAEPIDDPDELWVHELIGSTVVEVDGTERGRVASVQDNPASDLLVLDSGALVPVDFITERTPGRVTIDPPAGLFELFE